jgi:hypothetical protein
MTAVEEYTAHHSESLHSIMYEWGWATFEGMFRRHLLRKAREELRQMRDLRLAALDANMNYDSQENANAKQQRIDGLQDAFRQAEQALYSDAPAQDADTVAMENDPLFAPINQRARELRSQADQPLVEQAGMGRQLLGAT